MANRNEKEFQKKLSEIQAKRIINANDSISFASFAEVLKEIFYPVPDKERPGTWFPNNNSNGEKYVWFPKLSLPNGQPVAFEWDNYFFDGDSNSNIICQRKMLKNKNETEICKGNKSHYNNPLDCVKLNQPIPPLSPDICDIIGDNIHWHNKTRYVFAMVNKEYKFFGMYEFIGIQTMEQYEKIIRNDTRNPPCIKGKYIQVYKRISEELKINEWV